jgi:hypothetical protein
MSVAFHSVAADLTERKKERKKQDPMSVAFHSVVADLTQRKKEKMRPVQQPMLCPEIF